MVHCVSQTSPSLNRAAAGELRAYLARRQLSIAAVAEKMGTNPSWLAGRLNGSRKLTLDDIERICAALGVPVEKIVCPEEDVPA
jgi:transcriptional regulator with XRE-family HTH domain